MKRTRSSIIRWQFRRCAPTWLFSHDPFLMMTSFYFIAKCLESALKILKRMFFTLLFIRSRYIISILTAQIFLTRHSTNCRAIYFAPAQYLPKDPLISFSAAVSYLSSITSRANLYMKIVLSYPLVIRKQLVLLPLLSSLNMLERDN